jgi:stage II sporulation protein D
MGSAVVSVPLEAYVTVSALSEVAPGGEDERTVARVFDVQTVIARSYVAAHPGRHAREGYDVCNTTHCQVYDANKPETSRFASAARAATRRTAGLILAYGGRPAEALFHADCGGHTAEASTVWGGEAPPYLIAAPDEVPVETHRDWAFETERARLSAALSADPRTNVGTLAGIEVATRDVSDRAALVTIKGVIDRTVRGDQFRAVVNRTLGDRALQSTRFTLTRQGAVYRFTGSGWGHGVGLCQVGAIARARRGDSVGGILAAYYPGSVLTRAE